MVDFVMYILPQKYTKKEKYTSKRKYGLFQDRIKTILHQHIKKTEIEIFLKAGKYDFFWFIMSNRNCFCARLSI